MECVRPSAPGKTMFEKEQMSIFPGIIGIPGSCNFKGGY